MRRLLVVSLLLAACGEESGGSNVTRAHERPGPAIQHAPAVKEAPPRAVLFVPGLTWRNARRVFTGAGARLMHVSPWPTVQFANLITGGGRHAIEGERFMVRGRRRWASDVPLGAPFVLTRGDRETVLWSPGREFGRRIKHVVHRFHLYRGTISREEEIDWATGLHLYERGRRGASAERWRASVVRLGEGGVTMRFEHPHRQVTDGGRLHWTNEFTFRPGERHLLLLRGRGATWTLYLRLVAVEREGPVFYRIGPIGHTALPWPDMTAFRKERLDGDEFADQVWCRLLLQLWELGRDEARDVVAHVDYFDLLRRGMAPSPIRRRWIGKGVERLARFVAERRRRGVEVVLAGSGHMRRASTRVNLPRLLKDPALSFVESMGSVHIYGVGREGQGSRLHGAMRTAGLTAEVSLTGWGERAVVRLAPGFEAGYCPRRRSSCEGSGAEMWGTAGAHRGWVMTSLATLAGMYDNFSELGRDLKKK